MKRQIIAVAAVVGLVGVAAVTQAKWLPLLGNADSGVQVSVQATEPTEIKWNDLIPDDFVQPDNPFITMSEAEVDKLWDGTEESNAELERLQQEFSYSPIVEELDGKRVRLLAYVTPLEYVNPKGINEFLLVPYVGACIHTPPPPSNQIVHVTSPVAVKITSMNSPVWAVGTMRAESVKSELAESGYRLEVEKVLPYSARIKR